jgi:hypothetical protein
LERDKVPLVDHSEDLKFSWLCKEEMGFLEVA